MKRAGGTRAKRGTAVVLQAWLNGLRAVVAIVPLALGGSALAAEPAPDAGAPPVSQADATQGAVLAYEVYVGGIKAASFDVGLGLGPQAYSMQLVGRTLGFLDYMLSWRVGTETAGALAAGASAATARPHEHKLQSKFRGTPRTVEVRYLADGSIDTRIMPPPEDDDRDPVTAEQQRGTVDPLTASLALSRRLANGESCTWRLPLFDGRRRFDAVMTDAGPADLKPNRYSSFSGPAQVCDLVIKRIAGYSRKTSDWNKREDENRVIRCWYASVVPGAPPMPVRIEAEGAFGNVVVHLVRAGATSGRPILAVQAG
jgi:hypothetical protein